MLPLSVFANTNLEQKIMDLESRLDAMESAIEAKLGNCQLVYKHFGYRLNRCEKGTFVRSSVIIGGNQNKFECGYYQLQCQKN